MAVADNIRSDNKFMRLAVLLEPEIQRMLDSQATRTYGHDDVHLDAQHGVVTYFSRGHLIWEARAEVIGSFLPDFGLWRWWWTGRMVSDGRAKCSMDMAFSEGQRHGITTITNEHPRIAVEEDAQLISSVCAHLARADGLYRFADDEKVTFYGLFDTGKVRRASGLPQRSMRPTAPNQLPSSVAMRPAPSAPMLPVGERVLTPPPGADRPDRPPTAAPVRQAVPVPRQAVPMPRQDVPVLSDAAMRHDMQVAANGVRQEVPHPTQMPKPLTEFAREPSTITRMPDGVVPQAPRSAPSESREARYSIPDLDDPFNAPPDLRASGSYVARETTSTAMMTIAPAAMVPPAAQRSGPLPVREPSRDVVMPVVQIAVAAVSAALPNGFHQALIVVNVEIHDGKARFSVLVCVSDEAGELTLIDTSRDLIEATGRMIAEDARGGNGRWRRLTAKLSRTQRGAAIDVTVK